MSLRISPTVGEKAQRIYDQGRVTLLDADAARVIGDSGTYIVQAHRGGGWTCTCPAQGARCSHIAAASLAWAEGAAVEELVPLDDVVTLKRQLVERDKVIDQLADDLALMTTRLEQARRALACRFEEELALIRRVGHTRRTG